MEESSWERAERERVEGEQETIEKDAIERSQIKVERQREVKNIVEDILKDASGLMELGGGDNPSNPSYQEGP